MLKGSEDGTARVWDVASGQCIRILPHRGPLTNAFFSPRYKHFEADQFNPSVVINTFEKKRPDVQSATDKEMSAQVMVRCPPLSNLDEVPKSLLSGKGQMRQSEQLTQQVTQNELGHLRRINHQLYAFTVEKVLGNAGKGGGKNRK